MGNKSGKHMGCASFIWFDETLELGTRYLLYPITSITLEGNVAITKLIVNFTAKCKQEAIWWFFTFSSVLMCTHHERSWTRELTKKKWKQQKIDDAEWKMRLLTKWFGHFYVFRIIIMIWCSLLLMIFIMRLEHFSMLF